MRRRRKLLEQQQRRRKQLLRQRKLANFFFGEQLCCINTMTMFPAGLIATSVTIIMIAMMMFRILLSMCSTLLSTGEIYTTFPQLLLLFMRLFAEENVVTLSFVCSFKSQTLIPAMRPTSTSSMKTRKLSKSQDEQQWHVFSPFSVPRSLWQRIP